MCQSWYVNWSGCANWSDYSFIEIVSADTRCHIVHLLGNREPTFRKVMDLIIPTERKKYEFAGKMRRIRYGREF